MPVKPKAPMPDLLNKPLKNSNKIEKVGKSLRWHHVVAGLLVYVLIAGGLIWHATQHNQPASHAAATTQCANGATNNDVTAGNGCVTQTSDGCAGVSCNIDIYIQVNITNGSSIPGGAQEIPLSTSNYGFGNCSEGPDDVFYINAPNDALCYGYAYGPLELFQAASVSGFSTPNSSYGWSVGSSPFGSDVTCSQSLCNLNIPAGSSGTVYLFLTLYYTPSSGSGSSGSSGSGGGTTTCTPKPSAPSLSASSITQSSIGLSWSYANLSCSGDGVDYFVYQNGSEIGGTSGASYAISGLSCSTSYSYYVRAEEININNGATGNTNSNTITPKTSACSTGSTGSTGSGGSTGSSGGSTGSTGSGGSSLPPSSGSSGSTSTTKQAQQTLRSVGGAAAANTSASKTLLEPQGNQSTSSPPATPTGFSASVAANSVIVGLSWNPPTTGSAVTAYEIDRSTDNGATWQTLSSNIQNTFFSDLGANFSTDYLYRLVANNASGNSGYVYASISTAAFKSNAGPNQSVTLKSTDGVASALIPVGALSQPAACGLAINPILNSPNVKGYVPVAGPYTLTCKAENGSTIGIYNRPITISVGTSNSIFKKYKNLAYYGEQGTSQTWDALKPTLNSATHVTSFQLTNGYSFIVMGQISHAPWWVTFLIVLLVLGIIGFGIIFAIRTINARRQEQAYDVNYRKEWGL